jgi:hypothetical protein
MRALQIVVPGLFWPDFRDPRPYEGVSLPGLERLLARARLRTETGLGVEDWWMQAWGFDEQSGPVAALLAQAAGLDAGGRVWMCADPVGLQARGVELFLTSGARLGISRPEADALLDTLNRFFAADDLTFRAVAPDRWVVELPETPAMTTTPLSVAHGRAIDALLPVGESARDWVRRLNEAQMLLHDHPVNAAREASGRPTVNSVWFWGAGRLSAPASKPAARVFTDGLLGAALARAAGVPVEPLPDTAQTVLGAASREAVLLEFPACAHAAEAGDADGWRAALESLDTHCVSPALTALSTGMIDRLVLTGITGRRCLEARIARLDLLRFWRRPRPFGAALQAAMLQAPSE